MGQPRPGKGNPAAQALGDRRREANEIIPDVNDTLRLLRQARRELLSSEELRTELRLATVRELDRYKAEIQDAIEEGVQAVYDRFDAVMALCLNIDNATAGGSPLEDLIREFIRTRKLPYRLYPTDNDEVPEAFRSGGVRILADDTVPDGTSLLVQFKRDKNGRNRVDVRAVEGLMRLGSGAAVLAALRADEVKKA